MQRLGYITYSSSNNTRCQEAFWTRARSGPWKLLKIGPSIAVCGNTACTFPSCSGVCRHRWLILIKWIAPPKKSPFSFGIHFTNAFRCYSPDTSVRQTYGSFTSDARRNDCRDRYLDGASETGHVLRWWLVTCKFVSINSYSLAPSACSSPRWLALRDALK